MNIFLQAAANGIMVGGIYALIGMSLTLIFGVMKIINFCQGELLMLGMYISFVLFDQCGLDPFVAIPIVAVVMFAFGALLQSTLITRSLHGNDDTNVLFLTVGLGILFQNVALLYFKSDYRTAQSMFSEKIVQLGAINLSLPKVLSFVILLAVTILLFAFLKYTNIGKQIRATSQNSTGAQVCGIKTKLVYATTYGLGAAIAGITGSLSDVLLLCIPYGWRRVWDEVLHCGNHGRTGKCYRSLCQRHCIGTYGNRGSRGCGFLL